VVFTLLLYSVVEIIPSSFRLAVYFLLGTSSLLLLYFAIYLAPLYIIGFFGLLFLGATYSLFVPLGLLIIVIYRIIKVELKKIELLSFTSGIIVPLIILTFFISKWENLHDKISKATASVILRPENQLPIWVLLSQEIEEDELSRDIVKGELVFDTFGKFFRESSINSSFDERRRHDPIINIGISIFGEIDLGIETRIKVLKSNFDARHQNRRQLWSDNNLSTSNILTNIQIFPDYRLAYTEKILTIRNESNFERNQNEAVYTFHLPEGSVATSLSLWINGKEEKSKLTSKSKADSAYSTIVGVERRDPALLHWQEGNRLSVSVFPCTPNENRMFKLGITTPMELKDEKLRLGNIYFEGPIISRATETCQIEIVSDNPIEELDIPFGFKKTIEGKYVYEGDYNEDRYIELKPTKLSEKAFKFGGHTYSIQKTKKQSSKMEIDNLYLDINSSWDKSEYEEIVEKNTGKKIYAYKDKRIKIGSNNKDIVFEELSKLNFSLFPLGIVGEVDKSLIITKSNKLSPNLSDLEGSQFHKHLNKFLFSSSSQINVFQIDNQSSPYLKSVKEFDVLNFHNGSIEELTSLIGNNTFYSAMTDTNKVNLEKPGITIIRDTIDKQIGAPDHLLRLFAYTDLMREYGKNYFGQKDDNIDELVKIANEAYIVSPISSLIVLETQKDYDRFDIGDNENSLKNASISSSGAVPEPHEWALIGLFAVIIFFVYRRQRA
jgi:XrtN system VIT domain protein